MNDNKKIGIIDGHVQTAVSISQFLDNNGFKTFQAYNAQDGIEMIKKENPDLMLLDVQIDGSTGYEIANAVPKQKFFFMTSQKIEVSKLKSKSGYLGVISKPVDNDSLLKTIKKALKIK